MFAVLPEVFEREVCRGFSSKAVAAALLKGGLLIPGEKGRSSRNIKIDGQTRRFYCISENILSDPEDAEAVDDDDCPFDPEDF